MLANVLGVLSILISLLWALAKYFLTETASVQKMYRLFFLSLFPKQYSIKMYLAFTLH
jgi:hypothetical protein